MDYLKHGIAGKDIIWRYENKTLFIEGTGELGRFENETDIKRRTIYDPHCLGPWYDEISFDQSPISKECTQVIFSQGITVISSFNFFLWDSLERIEIPESVICIIDDFFKKVSHKLTFICTKGSYAEQYAKENNIRIEYIANSG